MQQSLFDFGKQERSTDIIAVDWAIKKDVVTYDGKEIRKYKTIDEFQREVNSTVLCETGIPKNLYTIEKEIKLIPGAIVKQKREELGWKKSDENDAKIIYLLHQEYPEQFRVLAERDTEKELLKKKVRTYIRYEKVINAMENTNKAFTREYGDFEDMGRLEHIVGICEARQNKLKPEIEAILKAHFYKETKQLLKLEGLSYHLVGELLTFIGDVNRFSDFNALKAYAGIAPNKGRQNGKDHRYSRDLKNTLLKRKGILDQVVILRKKEPYYSKYVGYKVKLSEANPDEKKWIIDRKARRKVADMVLKEIWGVLRGL